MVKEQRILLRRVRLMLLVNAWPGKLRLADLARKLGCSKSTAARDIEVFWYLGNYIFYDGSGYQIGQKLQRFLIDLSLSLEEVFHLMIEGKVQFSYQN